MAIRQKKDVARDGLMLTNFLVDMSPEEIHNRKAWLNKQSRQYIHAVEMEIKRLEQKRIMDSLDC